MVGRLGEVRWWGGWGGGGGGGPKTTNGNGYESESSSCYL